MAAPSQLSPLAGFTQGLTEGIPVGAGLRKMKVEGDQRRAKADVAEGFADLLNTDFTELESAGQGFVEGQQAIAADPTQPLKRVGYGGNAYFQKQQEIRKRLGALGDPDAVLAAEEKMAEITKTRVDRALEKAMVAAQFGDQRGIVDAAAEVSAYMFPGITPTIEMSNDGTAIVVKNKSSDGRDMGGLAFPTDAESIANLRHSMLDFTGHRTMQQQAVQHQQTMDFRYAQLGETARQFDKSFNELSAYQEQYGNLQTRQMELTEELQEIRRMEAVHGVIDAQAEARRAQALATKARLETQQEELKAQMAPFEYGKQMHDDIVDAFVGGEGFAVPMFGIGGSDPQQFNQEQLEQVASAVGEIATLNHGTPLMRSTGIEYLKDFMAWTTMAETAFREGTELPIDDYQDGKALVTLPNGRQMIVPLNPAHVSMATPEKQETDPALPVE